MYYECVVCISTFCSEDVVCSLQCGHVFHHHCLQQLNAFSIPKCPLCRCDSTIGVRRLHFAVTPDSRQSIDDDDLKNEVQQKSEIIRGLEKEIATMKPAHEKEIHALKTELEKEINALKTKLKKVENTNTTLKRDLKIAKEEKNKTQKENEKLSVANSQLLKKMEENPKSGKLKRIDNILQYQSASKAKVNLMASESLSTRSSASLKSHGLSMEPRFLRRNIAANVIKETPSSSDVKSTQKEPIKRRAMSSSQALFHTTVDNQTVKRTRGRMIDGELRPLRNL